MPTIETGDECPVFSLPDEAGEQVRLEDLKGKPFVLYFYPKDDTSGCTQEAIDFSAMIGEFAALGVPVLGVSPDPVTKHKKFKAKHELKVRLLSDEAKGLLGAFDVWVEKSMYGRRYMGVERTTALIDGNGRVARLWPKVKVPGHAAEVLDAARQLAAAG